MVTIGELSKISREFALEWRIKEFVSLPPEVDTCCSSPVFSYADASWFLEIYPNGRTKRRDGSAIDSRGYIDLYLCRESSGSAIRLEYFFSFKTSDGAAYLEKRDTSTFKEEDGFGWHKFLSRSELLKRESQFLPSGTLTVVFKMKSYISGNTTTERCSYCKMTLDVHEDLSSHRQKCMEKPIQCPECSDVIALKNWYGHECQTDVEGNTATERCSYCKMTLDVREDLSSHQKKCMDKPVKCPECSDVIALKNWYGHECQTGVEASDNWSRCFKEVLQSAEHSDVVVKVKGQEYRLHRVVLAARNSYFESMFKNDTKEKSSGIVTIKDCDPAVFRSFIHFIYTGKVDELSPENVCDLYEAADKYLEEQLKSECLHFMMDTLSVDSFCDYFAVALKYDEKELFQKSIDLFTSKGKEIARSVHWQTFVKEYPTQANELFIKTLDHLIK